MLQQKYGTTIEVGCDECGGGGNSDQAEDLGIAGIYEIAYDCPWSYICYKKDNDWRIYNTGCGWNIEHFLL